jgi:DNA replicative helicase MCM subunit Mcm2 (Cdc46/Mcm family)
MYFTGWKHWVQLLRYKCKRCGAVVECETASNDEWNPPPLCPNCDKKEETGSGT